MLVILPPHSAQIPKEGAEAAIDAETPPLEAAFPPAEERRLRRTGWCCVCSEAEAVEKRARSDEEEGNSIVRQLPAFV